MSLTSSTRLGVYEVTAQIGEGGMGQVYRARDTRLFREVALEVLPDSFANDADRLARFTREAQTLASLNHPNIAQIHGLEESGGVRALVLELVEGPTLADRIARGPIPVDEALPIALQIIEALETAHAAGIIHRDLKPANIWALGCVLFEMLTGRRAFTGEDVSETIAAILRAEPDWSALPVDLPPNLRRVLRRCLRKDPRQRLRDVGDARLELSDSAADPPRATGPIAGPRDFAAVKRAALCAARVAVSAAVCSSERDIWGVSDPPCHPPVEVPRLKRGGRSRSRCMSLSSGRTAQEVRNRRGTAQDDGGETLESRLRQASGQDFRRRLTPPLPSDGPTGPHLRAAARRRLRAP